MISKYIVGYGRVRCATRRPPANNSSRNGDTAYDGKIEHDSWLRWFRLRQKHRSGALILEFVKICERNCGVRPSSRGLLILIFFFLVVCRVLAQDLCAVRRWLR